LFTIFDNEASMILSHAKHDSGSQLGRVWRETHTQRETCLYAHILYLKNSDIYDIRHLGACELCSWELQGPRAIKKWNSGKNQTLVTCVVYVVSMKDYFKESNQPI
jgi:hypothetical protein